MVFALFLRTYQSKPLYIMDLNRIGVPEHPYRVLCHFGHFLLPSDQIHLVEFDALLWFLDIFAQTIIPIGLILYT